MRGDGEEEWGRDANATRWDLLQLLSQRGQGMAEPGSESPLLSPGTASTVPRYVGWFGEGRGDRAALGQRRRVRGFRGKRRCCWCGTIVAACRQEAGGGRRPHSFAAVLASASCCQPRFSWDPAPPLTQGLQPPHRHGRPFPIFRANTSWQRDCSLARRGRACAEDGCGYHVHAERLQRRAGAHGHPQHHLPDSTAQRGLNTAGAGGIRLGSRARALKHSRVIPKSSKASP